MVRCQNLCLTDVPILFAETENDRPNHLAEGGRVGVRHPLFRPINSARIGVGWRLDAWYQGFPPLRIIWRFCRYGLRRHPLDPPPLSTVELRTFPGGVSTAVSVSRHFGSAPTGI